MTEAEKEAYQNDTLALGNIPPNKRTGINREWLLVWEQVEIWYGDIRQNETVNELLLRLQKEYNLTKR